MDASQTQEQAVGISVFVRPDAPSFDCVIKQRYTDFLVNEILADGHVLHLIPNETPVDRKRKVEEDLVVSENRKKLKQNGDVAEQDLSVQKEAAASEKEEDTEAGETLDGDATQNGLPLAGDQKVDVKAAKEAAIASISQDDKATLQTMFTASITTSLLDLYACTVVYPHRKPRDQPTVRSKPFDKKSKRTEAHVAIRKIFGASKLESTTVQDGDDSIITIKASPPKKAVDPNAASKEQQKGKIAWSELGGEYLHFTLYKENKDTMEVLYFLASNLKLDIKHFSFAGTKDRRGVTVQRVAVRRIKRERLEGVNRIARGFRMSGPWEYKPEGLDLGNLGGNAFLLTLREVHCADEDAHLNMESKLRYTEETVKAAARNLTESGYLNFYGMQRFGTHSVGTHVIGMKMLKGNLKGAVDDILHYDVSLLEEPTSGAEPVKENGLQNHAMIPQDDIRRARAIHAFRTGARTGDVLAHLPGARFSAEKGMMTFLGKTDHKTGAKPNATDNQGALWHIARNLRLLYVHAYQGFVWNVVAGKRWETFGDKVVEGDLVVVGEKELERDDTSQARKQVEEIDDAGEPIIHPSASVAAGTEDTATANDASREVHDDPFVRARPLSKEEAASGRYTIFDVVLPLPGFDVIYPNNIIGKFYEEFMGSEKGGELDPHNMRRSWREISLSGGYRKMMSRPLSPGVEVLRVQSYAAPEEQIVYTDLETIEDAKNGGNKAASHTLMATEHTQAETKDKIAVVLRLRLGSSQYATMALRELTKGGAKGFQPQFSSAKR